jgi:ATPase subunit of ABC transporter with duplicated ATPase domains
MNELQNIKPVHRLVISALAQGSKLVDVCREYDLNYTSWLVTMQTALFKQTLEEETEKLQQARLQKFVDSPVQARLDKLLNRSVEVHASNMERIEDKPEVAQRAAESILDRAGFPRRTPSMAEVAVTINITSARLETAKKLAESPFMDNLKQVTEVQTSG